MNSLISSTAACLVFLVLTEVPSELLATSADNGTDGDRRAAVFVVSRDEQKINRRQVKLLEDLVSAKIASEGFQVLNREIILDSISRPVSGSAVGGERGLIKAMEALLQGSGESSAQTLEDQLDSQSSMLRLAQTLNANLIVFVVAESFGTERIAFRGNELASTPTTTIMNSLLISYRLAFAATGGAVSGDSVRVVRSWRESESLSRETDNLLNDMMEEAAREVAKRIKASNQSIQKVPVIQSVQVQFSVRPALPGGVPLHLPAYESGAVTMSTVASVAADVTLNGTSIGSVQGELFIPPGPSQILIQAEGFKPWKRFINVAAGQRIDVVLEMTPEGYSRWKEVVEFLSDLSRKAKITEAELKQMEAKADAMRSAGLIVTIGGEGFQAIRRE
jgi:hypothetical protein